MQTNTDVSSDYANIFRVRLTNSDGRLTNVTSEGKTLLTVMMTNVSSEYIQVSRMRLTDIMTDCFDSDDRLTYVSSEHKYLQGDSGEVTLKKRTSICLQNFFNKSPF